MHRLVISRLLLSAGLGFALTATAVDEPEHRPMQKPQVLSDTHGVCTDRYMPGIRRIEYHSDFMGYTVEYSSRSVNGVIRGSFGEPSLGFTDGFSATSMKSNGVEWTLLTGKFESVTVVVRNPVAGVVAWIYVQRDDGGMHEEAVELLSAMYPCEVRTIKPDGSSVGE